jgi:AcrR family transcriptional regulator
VISVTPLFEERGVGNGAIDEIAREAGVGDVTAP